MPRLSHRRRSSRLRRARSRSVTSPESLRGGHGRSSFASASTSSRRSRCAAGPFAPRRPAAGVVEVRVTAVDGRNRRSTASSSPSSPSRSTPTRARAPPRLDPPLARTVPVARGASGGTAGVYVQDLRTGRGASGTRARASRRLDAQARDRGHRPSRTRRQASRRTGSRVAGLTRSDAGRSPTMTAANALEVWLAGSTSAGSARVNETMRRSD